MIGKGVKFSKFECDPFHFPEYIDKNNVDFKNERQFIEFILRNDWLQKRIGVKAINSNGLFPDLKGEIYDGSGDKIDVEVELWAENYASHKHRFGGCNLILSFFRTRSEICKRGTCVEFL